ncbi:MAG TPA: hypothetical protein VNQ90_21430 [Chthoniobacteraceae bacterium]|nr:hypothetical protein [Chthoniobacteraceae bacterium]
MKIIDVNASFGFWPLQRFTHQTLDALEEAMARNGITEAWVSAIESILFPDPDEFDLPLFRKLAEFPRFRPVKTVNPLLANWRESCTAALKEFPLAALKIFPNYHGYPLGHVELRQLADFAAEYRLPVLVPLRINDERNQPTALEMTPVDPHGLARLAAEAETTTFVALCATKEEAATLLQSPSRVMTDISFLDGEQPLLLLKHRLKGLPPRLLFGSHAPFFYPESSAFKLQYAQLPREEIEGIASGNLCAAMEAEHAAR